MSGIDTFDFGLYYKGMLTGEGTFSFSDYLVGQTISAIDLLSFSVSFVSGPFSSEYETYTTLGDPSSPGYSTPYFEFNSATDTFIANTSGAIIAGSSPESSNSLDGFTLRPNMGFASIVVVHELEHGSYAEYGNFDTITVVQEPACYVRGTRIHTCRGDVLVEALEIGDRLITNKGQQHAIRWIGKRSYAGRFLAANSRMQPILFRTGSLGGGLPHRDLRVSPKHAMFLDDVLVPAECLVNGTTIVRERNRERVDYFHIELDHHDVILAEGAPSESFVDDNSRGMFHNVAEWQALHPGQERLPAVYCAPRVEHGPELEAIRRRLAVQAGGVAAAA